MIILVVDQSAEGQTSIARMIEGFDAADRDALDLQVTLANPQTYSSRVSQADVVILGAGLGETAQLIARQIRESSPEAEVIMYVSERYYSGEAFRQAHGAKVRKVIPASASPLDLLQELVAVQAHFRSAGRTKKGKLIVVTQAKGGIGATSLIAALAELSNESRNHTLLWDLDLESKDLSRGLNARGVQSQMITAWINGTRDLTRESLREAYLSVGNYVSLLTTPHDIAAGMDLIGHPDSIKLIHRIIELARVTQDTIIVDTAGKLTPATGTLLRLADELIVLIDDSLLGLSAAHQYLETILPLVKNNAQGIRILCAGTKLTQKEISELLGEHITLPTTAWDLPAIPLDPAAGKWAGTGQTMYSLGGKQMRRVLENIGGITGVWHESRAKIRVMPNKGDAHWMRMMIQKASNAM